MTFIKSRSQELDIPEGNPFENDKLGRSQFSNILTDVVNFIRTLFCPNYIKSTFVCGFMAIYSRYAS